MTVSRPIPAASAALAAFIIACFAVTPVAAAEQPSSAMKSATVVSCADGARAMASGMMPTSAVVAHDAADLDATYRAMASAHAHALMDMANLEMRCGHDAKIKAEAQRQAELTRTLLNTLQIY